MHSTPQVRSIEPHERQDYARLLIDAFLAEPTLDEIQPWVVLFETGRCLGAYDGDRLIGGLGIQGRRWTVPGGQRTPVAAMIGGGVAPDARRRGAMRMMMTRHFYDLHENGAEPVVAFHASLGVLYGRYGCEVGSRRLVLDVPVGAAWRDDLRVDTSTGELRCLDLVDAGPAMRAVHGEVVARPAMITRSEATWAWWFHDSPLRRGGAGPLRAVLHTDHSGRPDGYAAFRVGPSGGGIMEIHELMATGPAADLALWQHLMSLDHVSRVRYRMAPIDHPLPLRLADPRAAEATVTDALWVRLVDVDRALAARSLSRSCDVVVELSDSLCPWNSGSWHIQGESDATPEVTRARARADLTCDVRVLGAAYLGDITISSLAAAGRVVEHRPGAVAELSRALAHDEKPWTPDLF